MINTTKRTKIEFESKSNNNNYPEKEKPDISIREIGIDHVKAKTHTKIIIDGIEVYFPYEPYECQRLYMKKSINIHNHNTNLFNKSNRSTRE